MKVAQDIDVDNKTINVTNQKLSSKLVFSKKTHVVGVGEINELLFRQPTNSNTPMICTGYKINRDWYGDHPSGGDYIDPFAMDGSFKRNDIAFTVTDSTREKTVIAFSNVSLTKYTELRNLRFNDVLLGSFEGEIYESNYNGDTVYYVVFTLGIQVSPLPEELTVSFDYGSGRDKITMQRIGPYNGATVYEAVANSTVDLYDMFVSEG